MQANASPRCNGFPAAPPPPISAVRQPKKGFSITPRRNLGASFGLGTDDDDDDLMPINESPSLHKSAATTAYSQSGDVRSKKLQDWNRSSKGVSSSQTNRHSSPSRENMNKVLYVLHLI